MIKSYLSPLIIATPVALALILSSCSSNSFESVITDYLKNECTFQGTKHCEGTNSLIEITDNSYLVNDKTAEQKTDENSPDKLVRVIFKNKAFGFELDRFIANMRLREVNGKWKIIDVGEVRDFVN